MKRRHEDRSSLVSDFNRAVACAMFALGLALLPSPSTAQNLPGNPIGVADDEGDLQFGESLAETALPPPEARGFPAAQQTVAKPEQPGHTGIKALVFETGSDFKAFFRRPSTWVILSIGAGGAALGHPLDDDVNSKISGSPTVDDFFAPGRWIGQMYLQVGTAVGLYVVGRYVLPHPDESKTNKVSHLGFDMLQALIVSQTLTQTMKHTLRRDRPTGECCAFPSGHSSATFATASVLERHLGYRGSWPMFLLATYVATSRLHDNRHFLSDVIFGSALGIASGWTVVGRHGRSNYALVPVPIRGGFMVSLTTRPAIQTRK